MDNLTETTTAAETIQLVQYSKLALLGNSNYTRVKNSTAMPRDFSIRLTDISTNATVINFGPPPPPSVNIVSFRRFTLYQNSTGGIRRGSLIIQGW